MVVEIDDYLRLFAAYGGDLGGAYLHDDDERYLFLFEQVVRLLIQPSLFNASIPTQFVITARRYVHNDPTTIERMGPENRCFMLSDLHDWIRLRHAQQQHSSQRGAK